jgi:hypothetical protein
MHRKELFPEELDTMIYFDENFRSKTEFPGFGQGYSPIKVTVTRMATENTDFLLDAIMQSLEEAIASVP